MLACLLQEAATIYCICRQPYDESRPMLSCDHCEDWFHYDCIGLHPPRDDQLDADVAPSQLRCPKCCLVVSLLHCTSQVKCAAMPHGMGCTKRCWFVSHVCSLLWVTGLCPPSCTAPIIAR